MVGTPDTPMDTNSRRERHPMVRQTSRLSMQLKLPLRLSTADRHPQSSVRLRKDRNPHNPRRRRQRQQHRPH